MLKQRFFHKRVLYKEEGLGGRGGGGVRKNLGSFIFLEILGKQSKFVNVTNLARKIKERLMCRQIFILKSLLFGFMNKGILYV
jgi:hypothetical protein